MIKLLNKLQDVFDLTREVDLLAPLLLRLYLIPIFWMAGTQKLGHFEDTVAWFGNPEWGLGLPFPLFMASMADAVLAPATHATYYGSTRMKSPRTTGLPGLAE